MVVRERIDPGKAFPHEFLLEPEAAISGSNEDLGEKIAVPVGAASAEAELDRLVRGESFESRLGLLDEGPRVLAAPIERRNRRLGADQLHDPAIGKLEGLAVEHGSDGCALGRREVARQRLSCDKRGSQNRGHAENAPLDQPRHDLS